MQLMWVSGPTGHVRTISITARKVLIGTCAMAFALVATGFLLYLVGFKIAIEVRPELARSLGGVTTQAEQHRMESVYRDRLAKLQEMLDFAGKHNIVSEVEVINADYVDKAYERTVASDVKYRFVIDASKF